MGLSSSGLPPPKPACNARRPGLLHLGRHPRRRDGWSHAHTAELSAPVVLFLPSPLRSCRSLFTEDLGPARLTYILSSRSLSSHLSPARPTSWLLCSSTPSPPTPSFTLLPEARITHTHTDSCPNPPQPAAQNLILMPWEEGGWRG